MKESSLQILLAEHERLRNREQNNMSIPDKTIQLYLTVVSLSAGGIFLILSNQSDLNLFRLPVGLLLLVVAVLGEISFIRLVGVDIGNLELDRRYQLINNEFIKLDSKLENILPNALTKKSEIYHYWSSIGGILNRSLSFSGEKTTVTILNSLVGVALATIIAWPDSLWSVVKIGFSITILVVGIHVVYASWRYKRAYDQLSKDDGLFWKI